MSARQVYDTPELRHAILEFVDETTLAGMLSLEKAVTASVAAVLYREVPKSMVHKMSRASPRRATYCDAVRVLDWSCWKPSQRISVFRGSGSPPRRTPFDPEEFIRKSIPWRKKYPNLKAVRYQYPDNDWADAWVVHFQGDRFIVELDSQVYIKLARDFSLAPETSSFPAPPSHPLMDIRQTFTILFDTVSDWRAPATSTVAMRFERARQWRDWMFGGTGLESRISGFRYRGYDEGGVHFSLPSNYALAYLASRKSNGLEPLTQFHISHFINLHNLRALVPALGPNIRTLAFTGTTRRIFGDLQAAIDLFGEAFPQLQSLRIDFKLDPETFSSDTPLSGLPHLRELIFGFSTTINRYDIARYLRGIGGKDCVYLYTYQGVRQMEHINAMVHSHRTGDRNRRRLHKSGMIAGQETTQAAHDGPAPAVGGDND